MYKSPLLGLFGVVFMYVLDPRIPVALTVAADGDYSRKPQLVRMQRTTERRVDTFTAQ